MKTKITTVLALLLVWMFLARFYWQVSWTSATVVGLVISAIVLVLMKLDSVDKVAESLKQEQINAEQERIRKKAEEDELIRQEKLKKEKEDFERQEIFRKQKEKEEYEKKLKEIEDVEAAKARGKAKGLAELYKTQIDLLIEYKSKGVEIEKDIYSMREKLLSLEREENNAMIQDLMATLDKL